MGRKIRAVAAVLTLTGAILGSTALTASAGRPTNPNCWGVVTAQRASTVHDLGEHSSSQQNPRSGLGNVARALSGLSGGEHVSDLGSLLAQLDGLDQTFCPANG